MVRLQKKKVKKIKKKEAEKNLQTDTVGTGE